MDPLKLIFLDHEDLEVISAHLQDAVVKVSDVHWRPRERRLVIGLSRFDWESAQDGVSEYRRCLTALRFERVLSCKCRGVDPSVKDAFLNLLAIEFVETETPAGVLILTFSAGAEMRLDVECLEGELADLGPSWPAATCPMHPEAQN